MTSRTAYNNPDLADALDLAYHYELVSDRKRVSLFKKSIKRACLRKRVLESGTGSGILSIFAAQAGANKVYAVEKDPKIADFARGNILKSGYANVITLIDKDVREVKLDDLDNQKVDVVIAENLSTWQVTEPQISVMNHINATLTKMSGVAIPTAIHNYIELAHSEYTFENVIELRTYYFQFSGISVPTIFSNKVLFSEINLRLSNPMVFDRCIRLRSTRQGVVNSLRLTSPLVLYEDILFDSSDSLMPPVVVPLNEDVYVKRGETIEVRIEYKAGSTWNEFRCNGEIK